MVRSGVEQTCQGAPTSQQRGMVVLRQSYSHTHVKNQLIQVHGYSPHQSVFGRNPHIPEDLLNELNRFQLFLQGCLTEDSLAKSQAMRTSARVPLMKMQDDRALRVSLLARPRQSFDFKPGDVVAYWRDQKWVQSRLQLGGRWYGPALVVGHVGRNVAVHQNRYVLQQVMNDNW